MTAFGVWAQHSMGWDLMAVVSTEPTAREVCDAVIAKYEADHRPLPVLKVDAISGTARWGA